MKNKIKSLCIAAMNSKKNTMAEKNPIQNSNKKYISTNKSKRKYFPKDALFKKI